MPPPVLQITGLTKSFRGRRVVDGVDMAVQPGQIVGFLGPNGAGKTSVMNMVMGLMPPDGGQISLFGQTRPGPDLRLRLGYLQEKPRLYPEMTARAYLRLFADLHGIPAAAARVDAVLSRVGLTAAANRTLGTFSRGMQQRACLARVMLHQPEFLILDEPTLGLDPQGVAEMRDIFRDMRAEGTTLLFSSHQLAEIERVCDSVIFIAQGRVIASGPPGDLLPGESGRDIAIEIAEPIHEAMGRLKALPGVAEVQETGAHRARIGLQPGASASRADLARALVAQGLTPLSVGAAPASLEDLFLTLAAGRPTKGE